MTSVCERIGFKSDALLSNISSVGTVDPKQMGYIWVPPGLSTSSKVSLTFLQCHERNNVSLRGDPKIDSTILQSTSIGKSA